MKRNFVKAFMRRIPEGLYYAIDNLHRLGVLNPAVKQPCDTCGARRPGDRFLVATVRQIGESEYEVFGSRAACTDCVLFLANTGSQVTCREAHEACSAKVAALVATGKGLDAALKIVYPLEDI